MSFIIIEAIKTLNPLRNGHDPDGTRYPLIGSTIKHVRQDLLIVLRKEIPDGSRNGSAAGYDPAVHAVHDNYNSADIGSDDLSHV